jgi:hypothetical protein
LLSDGVVERIGNTSGTSTELEKRGTVVVGEGARMCLSVSEYDLVLVRYSNGRDQLVHVQFDKQWNVIDTVQLDVPDIDADGLFVVGVVGGSRPAIQTNDGQVLECVWVDGSLQCISQCQFPTVFTTVSSTTMTFQNCMDWINKS